MEHIDLNNDWKYLNYFTEEMIWDSYDESDMQTIRIPHANVITPFHYFDENIYQFVSCYRKHIPVKKHWKNKKVLITFEGVGHMAKVYMNGILIATHQGGYTAFTVDLSEHLSFDHIDGQSTTYVLTVQVDSRESLNFPPFGNVIDYMTYGGIYREVYLDIKDSVYIEDVFIKTSDIKNQSSDIEKESIKRHQISLLQKQVLKQQKALEQQEFLQQQEMLKQQDTSTQEISLQLTLNDNIKSPLLLHYSITEVGDINKKLVYEATALINEKTTQIKFIVNEVHMWDLDHPNLYHLDLYLINLNRDKMNDNARNLYDIKMNHDIANEVDKKTIRFGFRTCEFRVDGFYLNNKRIKLIGLNRHQSYPYVGYAMPKRMQQRDADILKNELGVNAVRTSHYPQSKHFIERCDELGLLVFTEIPGWQHIGDEEWKDVACEHVGEMVMQYRNHPSIILWGVRINESVDDDEFYARTNRIAHTLDSSRQTGGVRYLKESNLLEDVYTYNDFLHNGTTKGLDKKVDVTSNGKAPYLVSEYNGHMFPTKSFDSEEHRLEHALRHACVLDELFEQKDIAGGFGWCMFDYNTHRDFGSGDKICYHGVLDMFRNPKPAAYVYASQGSQNHVCHVSSTFDIGEHPGGNIGDIYVFTNADRVKLYKNDVYIKTFYPIESKYRNLPHPPICIDDMIGDLLEINEGFSKRMANGLKKVLMAIQKYGPNGLPLKYKVKMALIMIKEHLSIEDGTKLYYKYIAGWGGTSSVMKVEAIKDEHVVKVVELKSANQVAFEVKVGSTELVEEETYDVADVRITAVDESGNILSYYQEPVILEAWGAIEIIGPKIVSLKGGATGTYVRTMGHKGEGGLKLIQNDNLIKEIKFQVN